MPFYEYQHPETGTIIEVMQSMKESHVFVDSDGVEWNRVFNVPNAAIDTEMNPFSQSDWDRRTKKPGMTMGEMMDLSKEISLKREQKEGVDPIKNKAVKAYEKKCRKPHPNKNK